MTWSIRPGVPPDAARLATLGAEQFRQAYGPTHPEPALSPYLANAFNPAVCGEWLADPASAVLLVEGRDATPEPPLLGYAQLREGRPDAPTTQLQRALPGTRPLEIVRFYVDASLHGQGAAQALMAACDEAAIARGCDVLWLQAWQEATRALAFYRKAGFERYGTARFAFGDRLDSDFLLARAVARPQRDARGGSRVSRGTTLEETHG